MNLLHPIRFAYLKFRHRVRMRIIRIERRRHRAFLQMPFKPTDTWPKAADERRSIDRFRRESGR